MTVVACAGIPISSLTRAEAAQDVLHLARQQRSQGCDVHLCNAYTLALADSSPAFRALLERATRNFPDGMSVVWANRLAHGTAVPNERVYGPDLFLDAMDLGRSADIGHYLLGGAPHVVHRLRCELERRFDGVRIVGAESPPFRPLTSAERREQAARIVGSGAQIVWVGLGTPKQDWEVGHLAGEVPAVAVAVGAAFDFVAGTKRQAPHWMQRNGMEWAYRFATEPRRLWRRYLFGNVRFVYAASRSAVRPRNT